MSKTHTYYVYNDGTAVHEDDVTEFEPHRSPVYTVHEVPDEIFKRIHNNAVGSCCNAMDNIFITKKI